VKISLKMNIDIFNLSGKTAIITGASQGIGKGLAYALANAGANLALVSRNEKLLRETTREINKLGGKTIFIKADVAQEREVLTATQEVLKKFSTIDILVNCAGIMIRGSVENITEEDWDKLFSVNLKGVFLFSKAVGKIMIKQRKGKIINISSISSVVGGENIPIYSCSKGGVKQLTKAMAVGWAKYNINVNAIAPGYFRTNMTQSLYNNPEIREKILNRIPMRRWGNPMEDLSGAVIFLSSSASDYITGQTIFVDGGYLAY